MANKSEALIADQREALLRTLELRFRAHMNRHTELEWADVRARLEGDAQKLQSLYEMEETGGEPDVVGFDGARGAYIFYDCAPESPLGRRSLCYDQDAWESRKANKPQDSALGMARSMGIEILTEEQYRALQELGEFDAKTSSWIATPADIRVHGGALFCDRRYQNVFVYHNGAESYYAGRGFRGSLIV